MLEYDPAVNLTHYPGLDMAKYGKNTYGENLYRIVFSNSRKNLAGGTWPDLSVGYRWVPTYRAIKDQWVLERWLPCIQFAGSKQNWENLKDTVSGWPLLGPYPERGDYQHTFTFSAGVPGVTILDDMIASAERFRLKSFQDHHDNASREKEYEDEATRKAGEDRLRNRLSFKLDYAFAGAHGKRGTKTADFTLRAEDLTMGGRKAPLGNNKLIAL